MSKLPGKAEANAAKHSKDGQKKVTRENTQTREEVRKETVVHKQNSEKGG